jgi:hypothetical protein
MKLSGSYLCHGNNIFAVKNNPEIKIKNTELLRILGHHISFEAYTHKLHIAIHMRGGLQVAPALLVAIDRLQEVQDAIFLRTDH